MNKINDEKKFICLVKNFLLTCMSKNDYQHNVNKRFQNLPTPNPRQMLRECRDKQHTFERLCLDAYKSCETKYTVLCECIISIKAMNHAAESHPNSNKHIIQPLSIKKSLSQK